MIKPIARDPIYRAVDKRGDTVDFLLRPIGALPPHRPSSARS